jgi:glycosyltransferase involved in cell wall biosynthesis
MESVLVITPEFPWPLNSGSKIRVYHSIRALASRFETTVVSITETDQTSGAEAPIQELGAAVETIETERSSAAAVGRSLLWQTPYRAAKFGSEEFTSTVHQVLEAGDFDLVWAHFLESARALPESPTPTVVLDQHNAERTYWQSFSDGALPIRLYARLNVRFLEQFQRVYRDRIDVVVSVDETDANEALSWAQAPVVVIPNGVDVETFSPTTIPSACNQTVLFVGSLNVRMNEEALSWFVSNAWPEVRDQVPNATFQIVGRNPTKRVNDLSRKPGVEVVGTVDDVVPYYDHASVFVAPFAFGGGTKLKVLEALSMERQLIATPVGVKGINVADGEHGLIREREQGFSTAVSESLREPDNQLGASGRALVTAEYSWDRVYRDGIRRVLTSLDHSSER